MFIQLNSILAKELLFLMRNNNNAFCAYCFVINKQLGNLLFFFLLKIDHFEIPTVTFSAQVGIKITIVFQEMPFHLVFFRILFGLRFQKSLRPNVIGQQFYTNIFDVLLKHYYYYRWVSDNRLPNKRSSTIII